jgi:hypothetical protein
VEGAKQAAGNLSRVATHALGIAASGIIIAMIVNTQHGSAENLLREKTKFDLRCEAWDNSAVLALSGLIADRGNDATVRARRGFYLLQRARSNCRFREIKFARNDYDTIMRLTSGIDK